MSIKQEPANMIQQENNDFKEPDKKPIMRGKKIISILSEPRQIVSCKKEQNYIDEESVKGRFGWTVIDSYDIPYLFRREAKYCCLRMLEQKILNKLSFYFQKELLSCTFIRYVSVTRAEVSLLNIINANHCNFQFGKDRFTADDLLINIMDATYLCQFFRCCYSKLDPTNGDCDISKRCGFIRINKESVVPYSIMNDVQYVPLFYFDGEMEPLQKYCTYLENWELAYLKFCCKIQEIRENLFAGDSCLVIPLSIVKTSFPPNTTFEEFWPKRSSEYRHARHRSGELNEPVKLSSLFNFDAAASTKTKNNSLRTYLSQGQKRLEVDQKLLNVSNDAVMLQYKRNSHYVGPHNFSPAYANSGYKTQKVIIDKRMINCINIKPHDLSERWVTLQDLSSSYFYNVPVAVCAQVMEVLGIEIRKTNAEQFKILKSTGVYDKYQELSLVHVDRVVQYWPQIRYMLSSILKKD